MKSRLCIAVAIFAGTLMIQAPAWAAMAFAPAVNYAVGTAPQSVAIVDLNGDNWPDVAVANLNSNSVSVLLGNGDGTFNTAADYATGSGASSVAIADLNADDKPDLAVANNFDGTVSALLGNGDGTFNTAVNYATGSGASSVAIADLNADGKPDLAVANFSPDNVSILLGNGDGTFNAAVDYASDYGADAVAVADLNGDGKPDLAVGNLVAGTVSILLGNGDGTFNTAVNHDVGDGPTSIATADLDGDGDIDVATASSSGLSVFLGNGDGTLSSHVNYAAGMYPYGVAVADLNGDAKPDLAAANRTSDDVSVRLGNGDGTFAAAVNYPAAASGPSSVSIADLNGDAKPDLVNSNANSSNISVLLQGNSTFDTGPTATITGTARQGQTLTAHEGTPDPAPDSFTYKWFADGTKIAGQTMHTLLLTSSQVGKKISVEVTAKRAGYNDAADTSPQTAAVQGIFTPGPSASISGYARVGSTLTANAGSPSPTPSILGYRWFADGVQLSQVTKALKLTSALHGKRIQVKVYAIKSGYLTATSLSPATARVSSLQAKTISLELNDYTVRRGQRVYANLDELASGEPWSILLDGKKLVSGHADTTGYARTSFVIPSNATLGIRTIRANGLFPDRTDLDRITVR